MQCPRCGHENVPESRFCAQCGRGLEIVCPVCSTPAAIDARFCNNCGTALTSHDAAPSAEDLTRYIPEELLTRIRAARSGHAMRGERRTVTMLFADIEGSTSAAEGLDPEDWAEIINGAFEHLIAPVYRYEGTLARLQGDAVLAFFGAPIAHEDDPVRAVRAALEMVEGIDPYRTEVLERWGVPIDVRAGINTGLVVVGEVGSDLRVEYTALGDAINVAARMEQTAEPGTVRVTGETWELVADHFEAEEIGGVDVKGKAAPVPALRVLRSRGRERGPSRRHLLVGRSEELEALDELPSGLSQGSGWIASIMGEAGVGKTRLAEEFRSNTVASEQTASSHGEPGAMAWMAASSRSYDSSVPYAMIRDLLVQWWRLEDFDEPYGRIEEIASAVLSDGFQDAAIYLGHVAGSPLPTSASAVLDELEPPALHGRARRVVMAYLEAESSRRPVVVALEDLHWADAMSLTVTEDLMRLTEKAPVGVLFTMRPYRDEPTWHIHEVAQRDHPHRYSHLELVSLAADASEELLDSLLEGVSVPDETRNRILSRSDGNPLFIEQMAHAIRGTEADGDVQVPSGLKSLLTARLDRLHEDSRQLVQLASVLGTEFGRSTLASLVGDELALDEWLGDLLRRGVLVERRGESRMLAFNHALMQEAAYSTMLLRTRRELHHRVAEFLVGASADAVQEIARHYLEAGDGDAAFPYLVEAGERTSRSMALSDAIRFFTTALDNIPGEADPELVVRAHEGLGVAYSLVPDLTQSAATYQRLLDYAENADRPSAKVTALNRLALNAATLGSDLPKAHRYLQDAQALAEQVGDELSLADYHMHACFVASLAGELDTAVAHDEEIARLGDAQGVDRIRIEGLVRRAVNSTALMDFERAVPAVEDAIEAATQAGADHALAIVEALGSARLRMREGDIAAALEILGAQEPALARYASFYAPIAQLLAGYLLFEQGDVEAALSRLADSRRKATTEGPTFEAAVAAASAMLARVYASCGVLEDLAELRATALQAVQAPMGDFMASTVWADLGFADLTLGRLGEAEEDFGKGLAASSTTQFWERPRLLAGQALVCVATGRPGDGGRHLDEAQAFVLERDVRVFDAMLGHARGEVLLAEGRPEEAAARLEEALEDARAVGLRTLFIQIAASSARAAVAAGRPEAAGRHVAAAEAEVGAIARSVVDDSLRASLETAWLASLAQIHTG